MSNAGLGLRLHDVLYGSDLHRVFHKWWYDRASVAYVPIRDGRLTGSVSMYYDPILDVHHKADKEPGHRLLIGFWLVPQQRRDEARVLFDSVVEELGWDTDRPIAAGADPTALPSMMPVFMGMILAREFGEHGLYAKLRAHAEEHYRPTWDAATGEFSWAFGFNEPHPRGQPNAIMATVEAMREGAWSAIGARPNLRKFIDPTVHGVDFPTLCLSQASYDPARRTLVVATDAGAPGKAGAPTSFRIANINPRDLQVTIDGRPSDAWRIVDGEVEIATTVGEHTFLIAQRG